ncbi:unnamed protein product [Oikopleura dioica]|uniref:RING-type domain-containing protein n=1 Tax=Oikopleura dioica TaxID=34765 RepID=E4WV72_OIKDI|nr:unnamed protein product [Oikopleura dioica]
MGNCLRSEASDDESLIDSEAIGDTPQTQSQSAPTSQSRQSGGTNRQRRQRGWRNRRRQQQYASAPVVPDATQYFHFGANVMVSNLSEGEQIAVAQRLGMIQYLPITKWTKEEKGFDECAICFEDFEEGVPIRYLPCMHFYHAKCVDDWLIRSFTCPTCMAPVESGLQASLSSA